MKINISIIIIIIFFILSIFFIDCNNTQTTYARVTDISSNFNQYGDGVTGCSYKMFLKIDNYQSGISFKSLTAKLSTNPPGFYIGLNSGSQIPTDGTRIYKITFNSSIITGDATNTLIVTIVFGNTNSETFSSTYSYTIYCQEPPPPTSITTTRFIMSADRLYLVGTFKVNNWVRSNLPSLSTPLKQNKISFTSVSTYGGQDYYTVMILTDPSFYLSNTYQFTMNIIGLSTKFNVSIDAPFAGKNYIEAASNMTLKEYPSQLNVVSMEIDNILFNTITIAATLPMEYYFTAPNQMNRYSTIINGVYDPIKNITNRTWLNPYMYFNSLQHSYITCLTYGTNIVTEVYSSPEFSITSNYIQKKGTYLTMSQQSTTTGITVLVLSSYDLNTDSINIPITSIIINATDSNDIKYSSSLVSTFPYGVIYPKVTTGPIFQYTVVISSYVPISTFKSKTIEDYIIGPGSQNLVDTQAPDLNSFSITTLNDGHFSIETIVTEQGGSGFMEISMGIKSQPETMVSLITLANFRQGDIYGNATYQRIMKIPVDSIDLSYKFYVFDQAGNSNEYQTLSNGNPTVGQLISIPSAFSEMNNNWVISFFKFEISTMNLESNGVWNTAYLKFSNMEKEQYLNYPYFVLTPYRIPQNIHTYEPIPFIWNSTLNMYQVKFYIPSGIPNGPIEFKITNPFKNSEFYSDYIKSLFNNDISTQLISISVNYNPTPPIVSSLFVNGPFSMVYQHNTPVSGFFILTFESNDLEIGYITVATFNIVGNRYAKRYYNRTITPKDLVVPNSYTIYIDIICNVADGNTNYEIVYAKFINNQGYISEYSKYQSIYSTSTMQKKSVPFNPFLKLISNDSLPYITTTCDLTPIPNKMNLVSFSNSIDSIDVGTSQRKFTVTFKVNDTSNGFDAFHTPMVYLIGGLNGKNMLSFPVTATIISSLNIECIAEITVPYGFAYPYPIHIEIYGVVNHIGQIIGWSNIDLQKLRDIDSNSYALNKITTTMTMNTPYISSNVKSFYNDKQLIIYGFNLLPTSIVKRRFNTSDNAIIQMSIVSTTVFATNGNVMVLDLTTPINQNYLISVTTNGFTSDEYLIKPIASNSDNTLQPTQTPTSTPVITNAPQKCIGEPECGGPLHGTCSKSGCICNSPWIGIDCLSKVIVVPPPVVNPNEPSFNLTSPENGNNNTNSDNASLVGIISIVSLRELNINEVVIKTHYFPSWILTKLSEFENYYSSSFEVSTSNGLKQICNVTVSTYWYKSLTNITFANQELIMNPSTLKYNINITSYPFENEINTLELVISATAQITNKDDSICTDQQFGETTNDNSNYIKLSVSDYSLYGRFIKRGIIDDRLVSIGNSILTDLSTKDSYYSSQSHIGIKIPKFNNLVQLDPDFSVLIDSKSANSVCKDNSSGGLSKGALIGVIVGCVGGAVVAAVAVTVYYRYKYHIRDVKIKIIALNQYK